MPLKQRILAYIRKQNGFCNGGEIERLAMGANFKPSNASRRLRELYNEGLLERKIEKSEYSKIASVWYRATPPKKIERLYVPDLNKEIIKNIY